MSIKKNIPIVLQIEMRVTIEKLIESLIMIKDRFIDSLKQT
jgi:hypothetical protein